MRTTLTIDPDVAAEIQRRRQEGGRGLKEEVNRLLRIGLLNDRAEPAGEPVRTRSFSVGRPLVADVDDVASALARGEGEAFR
ncbi:MAG: hypothetical protein U0R52_11925 [Solirubrobacterales bacterium]